MYDIQQLVIHNSFCYSIVRGISQQLSFIFRITLCLLLMSLLQIHIFLFL